MFAESCNHFHYLCVELSHYPKQKRCTHEAVAPPPNPGPHLISLASVILPPPGSRLMEGGQEVTREQGCGPELLHRLVLLTLPCSPL